MKRFHLDNRGDTNFVSLVIMIAVVVVAVVIFKPYVSMLVAKIVSMLG